MQAAQQEIQSLQLDVQKERVASMKKEIDGNIKVARAELQAQQAVMGQQKTEAANEIISLGAQHAQSAVDQVVPKQDQLNSTVQQLAQIVQELGAKVDQMPGQMTQMIAAQPKPKRRATFTKMGDGKWSVEDAVDSGAIQ
jgi:hypothetical protein